MAGSIDPAVAARLEAAAAANPKSYQLKLAALAIAGDVALTIAQVLPVAGIVIIGMILMNNRFFYAIGTTIVLITVWVLRPDSRVTGRILGADEAPKLRAEVEALQRKIGMPGKLHVRLDGSFNASAMELRGIWGLIGTKRILTLGIPLLLLLSREEVLAVVAHEFGHFSRKHNRLGNWVYRARVGWLRYIRRKDESPVALEQVAALLASRFVPYFSVRSFVHSRQCEYDADRDAAAIMGGAACAAALTRTAVLGGFWQEEVQGRIGELQVEFAEPIADIYQNLAQFALAQAPANFQERLQAEMAAATQWEDPHPTLPERLGAIGQAPNLPPQSDQAGEALLGEAWPAILGEFNADWASLNRLDWTSRHFRLKHLVMPLVSGGDGAPVSGPCPDWVHARALWELDSERGLAELKRLYETDPTNKPVRFAYAVALLERNDDAGAALLEKLAREDAEFWYEAVRVGREYFRQQGNAEQWARWATWFETAKNLYKQPLTDFFIRLDSGQVAPSTLPAPERAFLAEVLDRDPCVENAWLVGGHVGVWQPENRPKLTPEVHLLVAALDVKTVEDSGQNVPAIAGRYQELLRDIVPPNQIAIARLYFETEKMPVIYRPDSEYALNPA